MEPKPKKVVNVTYRLHGQFTLNSENVEARNPMAARQKIERKYGPHVTVLFATQKKRFKPCAPKPSL